MWKLIGTIIGTIGVGFGLFAFFIGEVLATAMILAFTAGTWLFLLGIDEDIGKITRNQQRIHQSLYKIETQLGLLKQIEGDIIRLSRN